MNTDPAHDNSASGIKLRALYAEGALTVEARLVAQDVGGPMAVCALLGVAATIARESGVPKAAFESLLIELLYSINTGQKL